MAAVTSIPVEGGAPYLTKFGNIEIFVKYKMVPELVKFVSVRVGCFTFTTFIQLYIR